MVTIGMKMKEDIADDDVVISGFSGKFPDSDNIDEFSENLFNMADLVRPNEDPLWKNSKLRVPIQVGLMRDKSKFDAGFFGIHSKHASTMDVTTRLVMERAYEAIVDAGINPNELRQTHTAVISSTGVCESENTWLYSNVQSGLEFLGHSRSMLANRLSYWLDLHATSYTIVSMETCGLESLTIAYHAIKSGRVDAAIISSISLVLLPEVSYHYQQLGLLSEDGKTRSFDAAANGYGRSDGVAVMLLQKAKCAKRIYACVVHSAAEICGNRMTPLITPMREPLINLMERFYQTCGVDPTTIQFLEADGSATKGSDVEELSAVEAVLLQKRKTPLLIGSVKSNMGHCYAASSFASICKVLIAMQTGKIPPNINYEKPCDVPALRDNRLKVVTESTPWEGGLVAVNSIGLTGVYAHALLKSFKRSTPKQTHDDGLPRLVVASARTQKGLEDLCSKLESRPMDVEFIRLVQDVYSMPINNHLYRGYTILPAGETVHHNVQHIDNLKRPIWFIFSGMGSQWPGMGRELMKLPVCAATIDKCHNILKTKGLDLKHIITTEDPSVFDTILHSFVGIAAIQLALVDALTLLGIVPDGMVGHSVGELGCSYADGCLTLEQMLLAAYYRGMASIESKLITGYMAAIGLGRNQVKNIVPPEVDVACHNSETSCTISGPVEPVKKFVAELQRRGIFARVVNVANIAYHSRYIQPAAPALLNYLTELIPEPKPRSPRWICSSVPEESWDSPLARYCSADYHTNNLLSPVLFEEASKHVPKDAIAIEVAPHGLLQAILRRSLGPNCTNIALTQRAHPQGLHFLLSAIGKIYMVGGMPQVSKLYPPVQFPVSNNTPSLTPLVSWDHSTDWHVMNEVTQFDAITGEADITVSLSHTDDQMYAGHVVQERMLYPTFGYLKIVWEAIATLRSSKCADLPVVFEDIRILQPLEIPERGAVQLFVMVQRGSGDFEICKEHVMVAKGKVTVPENVQKEFVSTLPPLDMDDGIALERDEVYEELEQRGYQYRGVFKGILNATLGRQGCTARVQWTDNLVAFGESLLQMAMLHSMEYSQSLQLPVALQKVIVNPSELQSPVQGVDAVYNHVAGVLHCSGLELHKVRLANPEQLPSCQSNFTLKTVKFICHMNPKLQSVQQFLQMCMQLVIENSVGKNSISIVKLSDGLDSALEALLPHYPQVSLKTTHNLSEGHASLVVVTDKAALQEGCTLVHQGFLLLSMGDGEVWPLSTDLVTVAEQKFGNRKLALLRKAYQLSEQRVCVLTLGEEASSWLAQVQAAAPCERLYAVVLQSSAHTSNSLCTFLKQLAEHPQLAHVRCVFVEDGSAPAFSLHNSPYLKRLCLDLVTNIFKNGVWGSYHNIPITTEDEHTTDPEILPFDSIDGVEVQYLGLNLKHADTEGEGSVEIVEFAGRTSEGQQIMGIARDATKEQYLVWHVPPGWSLEAAATVPLAYATAYYVLQLTARLRREECVLIHKGWTNIGQAAISVALDHACTVFTTVATPEHRLFLKKRFPQLLDSHILGLEQFDTHILLQTAGKGCSLILNTLSGPKMSRTVRCLATHGRLLQMAAADIVANKTLGETHESCGKAEQCVDVTEWLVQRGAQHVVLALRSKAVPSQVTHRISLLRLCHNAHVVLVSTPAPTTSSNATNVLQAAASAIGVDIGAIFILPAEPSGHDNGVTTATVSQLDIASRNLNSLEHFVCFLSEGSWNTCEARHRAGLPALAVHWPKYQNLRRSLHVLDAMLTKNVGPVVMVTQQSRNADVKTGL
ncbi:hypothetical protein ANN_24228 [Periplaneta americana]|uniref:Uncharacterized protein n=1 Tax=Periplaneta americana TaxID=6978 RepID=A0ABQ8S2I1_PERAM|nr:hypothetical protein ANN_24228 [Periplaneta americana]